MSFCLYLSHLSLVNNPKRHPNIIATQFIRACFVSILQQNNDLKKHFLDRNTYLS